MFPMFSGTGAGAQAPPPDPEYDTHETYDYHHEYYYNDCGSDTTDDDGELDTVLFAQNEYEPDMSTWSHNDIGEFYYQQYRRYRKKWRIFTGRGPRRGRKGRGISKGRHYDDHKTTETYLGKGKKGKGYSGNPIGRDG